MIQELHISNLAVIEDTTLEFTSKDTALVGETGAGKSLIVNSLLLLAGNRCDYSLVRDSKKKACASALFHIEDEYIHRHNEILPYLDENHDLLLKRVLNPDKSNRFYVNGEPYAINELKDILVHLIDIHSQNQKSDLLDETKQIQYVDFYDSDIQTQKQIFQKKYDSFLQKKEELNKLLSDHSLNDRDYLEFQVKEIEKYHLKENEIEDLEKEFESLRDFDRVKEEYDNLENAMNLSQPTLNDYLSSTYHCMRAMKSEYLKEDVSQCMENILALQSSLSALDESFSSLKINPRRIDEINERLFSLKGLIRKYGKTTDEILRKYHDFKDKLAEMDSFEETKSELEEEMDKAKQDALREAKKLSQIRKKAAESLTKDINGELSSLGLRKEGFRIDCSTSDELTSNGIDRIVFYVSLNEGLEENTLSKAASGGEASRLMLALKVVLSRLDPYDLMVLDEIDTGISGKTAYLVAKKIRELSAHSSLIVISHIPQVVSSATTCIKITKSTAEDKTFTTATSLNDEEMIAYIASMLSLDKVTKTGLDQAKALYDEFHS
jgi:DNA repair protein RecN (Recombination protein N)